MLCELLRCSDTDTDNDDDDNADDDNDDYCHKHVRIPGTRRVETSRRDAFTFASEKDLSFSCKITIIISHWQDNDNFLVR